MAPVLIGVSAALLARAFYVLYVLKQGNRFSAAVTWTASLLIVGFWSWKLWPL